MASTVMNREQGWNVTGLVCLRLCPCPAARASGPESNQRADHPAHSNDH